MELGGISLIIGMYDSGLGGLSVWRELRKLNVKLVYFGDTAHVPYGDKTAKQLVSYFWDVHKFLQGRNCELMVVACNTASALVLPEIQTESTIPVLGIIEAAVTGCLRVSGGRIGVLATPATVASGIYQIEFSKARPNEKVFMKSAPSLASLIEAGKADDGVTKEIVAQYLAPLQEQQIDTLLLGCTHYALIQPLIADVLGPTVQIVDPAPILAAKVAKIVRGDHTKTETEFWVSADPLKFQETAQNLLKEEIPFVGLHQLSGENV